MMLVIRNLIRRLKGKPPISDLCLTIELSQTADEMWDNIDKQHHEAILVCVEHPKNKNTKIKCYAKIAEYSKIPMALKKFWENINKSDGKGTI